jgi:hypothetical protein
LENTNCCQPWQADGFAAPLQAGVVKVFALSWSEKSLAPVESLTLVRPVTLSNDPAAVDIKPDTWAAKSLPSPTVLGRLPLANGYGYGGAVVHRTSCHSVLGYEALKHPAIGKRARDMDARQASRLPDCAGAGCVEACAMSWGEIAQGRKNSHSRLAKTMVPGTVTHLRASLKDLIGCCPANVREACSGFSTLPH